MQIQSLAQLHGPQSLSGPHAARSAAAAPRPSLDITDRLDISPQALLAGQLSEIPDIRHERVASIRAQIASGAYETPEKLDRALEALLNEIG